MKKVKYYVNFISERTEYSGKFMSERTNPDEKIDVQLIHDRLKIVDWFEYYFFYCSYKEQKNKHDKEIGQILNIGNPAVDFNITVKVPNPVTKTDLRKDNIRLISSIYIIRKLENYEIDSEKYNL